MPARGVDRGALRRLVEHARETSSSALVVLAEGKTVVDETFGRPRRRIEAMSCTKSLVSLAVGMLIDDGKIPSVDTPVRHWFPAYAGGGKERVTVRHLLEHTSGIACPENAPWPPDLLKDALEAPLSDPPGRRFRYNNRAANLLAAVVSRAAGERMDLYLRHRLFEPLGITDLAWLLDDAGNADGQAGCRIHAPDLARIGQMLADGGVWRGRRIVSRAWIGASTRATRLSELSGEPCARLWWPVATGRAVSLTGGVLQEWWANIDEITDAMHDRLLPLVGRPFPSRQAMMAAVRRALADDRAYGALARAVASGRGKYGPVDRCGYVPAAPYAGYAAEGFLGNYLVVLPRERIVAVRMNGREPGKPAGSQWVEFPKEVAALVRPSPIRRGLNGRSRSRAPH